MSPKGLCLFVCCISLLVGTGFTGGPHIHDRSFYESRGEVVWEVPMKEKLIALTFDDGPDRRTTPEILDLLNAYHAKATFFVIGNRVDKYPELVIREDIEGHEVANHTYNHTYFTRRMNGTTIRDEMINTQNKITEVTGKTCRWFRPPGGYYDDQVVNMARQNGYTIVLWSWHQDTKDWRSPGVEKIVKKVLNNARNGDIVLLHDHVNGSTQTVEALKKILPELVQRGYRMVTITELMEHKRSKAIGIIQ